jgi:hypothetical protein
MVWVRVDEMEEKVGTHAMAESCSRYSCVKISDEFVSKGSRACTVRTSIG